MASLSAALLIKALDGLSLRAQATAENIANASTPGYRPLRVSFEQALAQAALGGTAAVSDVKPRISPDTGLGGDMRLDLEMITAASTADRYGALVDVLNRQMQLSALVVAGSK